MRNSKTFIRMSGLGGQGVVTAAHILGVAAVKSGLKCTVNPFFGAEKRLAPTESYVRIAAEDIWERGEVLFPNIVLIFHPHVITLGKCYTMPFFAGLQQGGKIIINADRPLDLREEELARLRGLDAEVYYVPATQVAVEAGGTALSTNIAILGALLAVEELVSQEAIRDAIAERFGGGKFVASGTTAVLDDVLKSKFDRLAQLIEKNMAVVAAAGGSVSQYHFGV